MNVVILEDEFFSAEKLALLLEKIDPGIRVLAVLPSVEKALAWFRENPEPDLVFADIQLEDQQSFALFQQRPTGAPIIYTTAFDQYALRAFKENSVDYLLKPIVLEELRAALKKYEDQAYRLLKRGLRLEPEKPRETPKERFLVKKGGGLAVVKTTEIAYFKSEDKITLLVTHDNHRYTTEATLDQLGEQLEARRFNRISRNRVVSLECIRRISPHFNGRLKLELAPPDTEDVFVSRDRVQAFKEWLDS